MNPISESKLWLGQFRFLRAMFRIYKPATATFAIPYDVRPDKNKGKNRRIANFRERSVAEGDFKAVLSGDVGGRFKVPNHERQCVCAYDRFGDRGAIS
jgi:hypothetical protein